VAIWHVSHGQNDKPPLIRDEKLSAVSGTVTLSKVGDVLTEQKIVSIKRHGTNNKSYTIWIKPIWMTWKMALNVYLSALSRDSHVGSEIRDPATYNTHIQQMSLTVRACLYFTLTICWHFAIKIELDTTTQI